MNSVCRTLARCSLSRVDVPARSKDRVKSLKVYAGKWINSKAAEQFSSFNISITHEMCSLVDIDTLNEDLKCTFKAASKVKQIIILRYAIRSKY